MSRVIFILSVFIIMVSCSHRKTAADVKKLIYAKEVIIVDLRSDNKFADGHIPGAVNIEYLPGYFEKEICSLRKDATVILYCNKEIKSEKAVNTAQKCGFNKLYTLESGFSSWKKMNYPQTKGIKAAE